MRIVKISEMVEEMRPVWIEFIVGLGYTEEQGEKFAEGYAKEMSKLPTIGKLRALDTQDDKCMTAGFLAAGINEDEAFERANS